VVSISMETMEVMRLVYHETGVREMDDGGQLQQDAVTLISHRILL
jgi:hypothetical protein